MMSLIWGCNGKRLNKVRLMVKRGLLLQMASTSAKPAARMPAGVTLMRADFSLSACHRAAGIRATWRCTDERVIAAGFLASGSSGEGGRLAARLSQYSLASRNSDVDSMWFAAVR